MMKVWLRIVVLLYCEIVSRAEWNCHCKKGCSSRVEKCTSGCLAGWYGNFCQKRNVALNGTAFQQGVYGHARAELAVDGNTNTYYHDNSCSHTSESNNAWWKVELTKNGMNQIRFMTIHNRNNSALNSRRRGMEILVNNTRCKKWDYDTLPEVVSNVECTETLDGDIVEIKVPGPSLSLCEVQVFVCSDYWFGKDCDNQCKCYNSSEICDKGTGKCTSGCRAGYKGSDCQKECANATYGLNCSAVCNHCQYGDICNKTNGHCPRGCEAGWSADRCDEECKSGTYGLNCSSTCGHCFRDCNKTDGHCHQGCVGGWTGDKCDAECANGSYGLNCSTACGHCQYGDICNKTNGHCPWGCEAGWNADRCDAECESGKYGLDCASQCGQCVNKDVCNKTDGHCPRGCEEGWITKGCSEECEEGAKGDMCKKSCGMCRGDQSCDNTTGQCLEGCVDGYRPLTCTIRVQSSSITLWSAVVIVGIIIGLLIVGIIIATLWIRRRRQRVPAKDDVPAAFTQADGADMEPVIDVGEELVEDDEVAYAVEMYVDDTYENATSCRKFSPTYVAVDKLQQYIQQMSGNRGFKCEYKLHPYGINGLVETGKLPENKKRNRFVALYPYDHTRVVLDDGGESDYINANFIPGLTDNTHYIATQGPTVATVNDFWRMVWQEEVSKIVMVTNLMEMNKKKCEQYWPSKSQSKTCGYITITNENVASTANYNISTLVLKHSKTGRERKVSHFHFTAWPDHDVPSAPALVTFWKKFRQAACEETRPMVVHCSAGVGRTGTFIALDYLMDQAKAEDKVSVYQCVARQRAARMNMIQTVNQYEFVHWAVLEGLESKWTLYSCKDFEERFGSERGYNNQQENMLKKEFKSLQSLKPPVTDKDISEATLPENVAKNKDGNILPRNKSRPFLSTPVTGTNNYINAVILPCYQKSGMMVVTQTPMPHTVVDFWRLVYDHDCFVIVCLDDITTGVYPCVGKPIQTGPFAIEQSESNDFSSFIERKLILKNTKQTDSSRSVTLLSFKPPTQSKSRDPASLLELVTRVDMMVSTIDHKVLLHCPDGAEVCGVFNSVLNIVSRLRHDEEVDVFLTIRELQLIRPQFVQTNAQYKLCYDVVKEYIRTNSVYVNT